MSEITKNLLDDLLIHFQKTKGLYMEYKNRENFVGLVFPKFNEFADKGKNLIRSEEYNKWRDRDFRNNKNCYAYICDENSFYDESENQIWKQVRMWSISSFIRNCVDEGALGDLRTCLISLLEKTDIHDEKLSKKLCLAIDKLKITENMNDRIIITNWEKNLYYYFYFAVTNRLHSDMTFLLYPELESDMAEYNSQVTLMYGVCGNPGMYRLYMLANRRKPNIIALYECGELEYYGKGPSGKVNLEKAYEYYELTKECNKDHPLATWSIAYMRFHYSQEIAKKHPEYRVQQFENELKNGKKGTWYDTILYNVEIAYDNGCSAAANLLGKILDCTDEEFPFARRGKFRERKSKDLYRESADAGYVFGCNNYANLCLKEAVNELEKEKKRELYMEAVKYFEKSAKLGNPWAANKMGCYYIKGLEVEGIHIVKKSVQLAHKYFAYAMIMEHSEKYFWPFLNMAEHFWLNTGSNWYGEKSAKEIIEKLESMLREVECNDKQQIDKAKELLNLAFEIERG